MLFSFGGSLVPCEEGWKCKRYSFTADFSDAPILETPSIIKSALQNISAYQQLHMFLIRWL